MALARRDRNIVIICRLVAVIGLPLIFWGDHGLEERQEICRRRLQNLRKVTGLEPVEKGTRDACDIFRLPALPKVTMQL